MAFIRGTEMLKPLRIKQMAIDLGWSHNTFELVCFHLNQVTT